MKIYIVTDGCYSDYHIEEVFLDKIKAEEYCELNNNDLGDCRVEEYDTFDDNFQIGKYSIKQYLSINYESNDCRNGYKLNISLDKENTFSSPDLNEYPYNYKYYSYHSYRNEHDITIHKLVDDDYILDANAEILLKDKYLKICRDYVAKAISLHELEGVEYKNINEILWK